MKSEISQGVSVVLYPFDLLVYFLGSLFEKKSSGEKKTYVFGEKMFRSVRRFLGHCISGYLHPNHNCHNDRGPILDSKFLFPHFCIVIDVYPASEESTQSKESYIDIII